MYFGLQHSCDEFAVKGIPGHFTEHSHVRVRELPSSVMKDFLEQDGLQKRVLVSSALRLERLQSQVRTLEAEEQSFQGQVATLLQSKVAEQTKDGWIRRCLRLCGV
eukprot:m.187746 g.187746  ORF g.187746 m.187746 type:complete len:106 (+) comp16934_c1_seq6:677-994(+)